MSDIRRKFAAVVLATRFMLFVSIGTIARASDRYYQRFVEHFGVAPEPGSYVRIIHFDAQEDAAAAQIPSSGGEDGASRSQYVTFVAGQTPDEESLREMEEEGHLYFTQPDWVTKAGQAKEDAGTGGNPRVGRALFVGSRADIEKAVDDAVGEFLAYRRQQAKVIASDGDPDGAVLPVVLTYSTPGGVGPGARHEMTRLIEEVARKRNTHVKVYSVGIALGSIAPVNPPQGIRNEVALFIYTQADQVADLDYAGTDDRLSPAASESTILITNQNEFGEITSLQQVLAMVGYIKFMMACTASGRLLTERTIDIEKNREFDDHGGPCSVSTMGLSIINVNVNKVLAYAGCEMMGELCATMLTPPDSQEVRREVLAATRDLKVMEQPDEPLASAQVSRSEMIGAANVYDRLTSVFNARPEARFGFRLSQELPAAFRFCVTRELSQNLLPVLQEESRMLLKKAMASIKGEVNRLLKQPDALKRAQSYLSSLRAAVKQFSDSNAETTRAVVESLKPLEEALSGMEDEIERLAQEGRLGRLLKPFTIARINRTYRLTAEAALRCHAEIELRNTLAQDLYRPSQADLAAEETRINAIVARAEALADRAKSRKEETANAPADRLAPVGYEIATPVFLSRRTDAMIDKMGGRRRVIDGVFQSFLRQFGSIEGLFSLELSEAEDLLAPILEAPFEETVRAMDVFTVFREEHPDPSKQRQIVEQQVRQAAGRLMVTGEAGKQVPWIKIAGVGSVAAAGWFLDILRQADPDPSQWHACENGDPYSVSLLMYRTGISLDGLLQQVRRRHGIDPRSLTADSGPDTITWDLPSVRPDRSELSRTIARALVIGAIREQGGLFTLVDPATGEAGKGYEPKEFRHRLTRDYRTRVGLTVDFYRGLVRDHKGVLSELRSLGEKVKDTRSVVSQLIDGQAVSDVESRAEQSWQFLKRVQNAGR